MFLQSKVKYTGPNGVILIAGFTPELQLDFRLSSKWQIEQLCLFPSAAPNTKLQKKYISVKKQT